MVIEKKDESKKEIERTVRRLNFITRFLTRSPSTLTALTKKLLLQGSSVDISKEIEVIDKTPQIALIGKAGVGKSLTINKLFNPQPNLRIDQVEHSKVNIEFLELFLGERGKLIVVDSLGTGVSEESVGINIVAYKELLVESDVAIWIIKADDEALGIDQSFISQVLPDKLRTRLVVGINQIDKIEPAKWSNEFNLPSREQEINIQRKEKEILKDFKVEGIDPFAVVSYSASRNYRLTKLFRTMVDACSPERVAALIKRADVKSFLSPELRDSFEE